MTDPGFEAFVERRGQSLWRAAWLLTGDRQRAEDLVQTALTRTYARYHGDDEAFEAYLRATMYNAFCSWWRRKWRGEVPSEALPDEAAEDGAHGRSIDVARALAELPAKERAVVVLRYFEDRPIAEVARTLGLAPGTVKAYSHHALNTLRASRHLVEEET